MITKFVWLCPCGVQRLGAEAPLPTRAQCVDATGSQPQIESGLRVRINHEVSTTTADSSKRGNVQVMEFGIPGCYDLVWDVSLACDRISSSTQHGMNGELQLRDYLNARARIKINQCRRDYAAKNIAFATLILSVAARVILNFYVFCGCWLAYRQ